MAAEAMETSEAIEFSTALLRAANVNAYFDVVARWLPRIVRVDYYNFLITNPPAGTFLRHMSPGFPTAIYENYEKNNASSDLMLKLAMAMEPGSYIHFDSLKDFGAKPEGWDGLVKRTSDLIRLNDALTLILHNDRKHFWGAGLTLWRVEPGGVFSAAEVDAVAKLCPLLAAAFGNVWNTAALSTAHDALTGIFFHTGNVSFVVRGNGAPVKLDDVARDGLRAAFGGEAVTNGLPAPLASSLMEIIGELESGARLSLVSREVVAGGAVHRVYVSRGAVETGGGPAYQVVVMCGTGFADLLSLSEAGFTPREIEILEYLQRGLSVPSIGAALGVSENTVKFHIKNAGDKLSASGQLEVLSRALSLSREIAVRRGLSGTPPG